MPGAQAICTTRTNWGWFEDQKKVKTGIRLRFGLGGTDDLDGLEENHDPFVEVCGDDLGT